MTGVALNLCCVSALSLSLTTAASATTPAGPVNLTAVLEPTGNKVGARLNWTPLSGAQFYRIYRNGIYLNSNGSPTYLDATIAANTTYTYYIIAYVGGVVSSPSSSVSIAYTLLGAPQNFTATPQWAARCPVCHGLAMAHIKLGWDAVSGASAYNVYRDGVLLQSGLTTNACIDMAVISNTSYSYTVTAIGANGEGAASASVSATAPAPPPGAPAPAGLLLPPTNVRSLGVWTNASTDVIAWDSASDATSYNVYQYDTRIASGVQGNTFFVPTDVFFKGLTYQVTSVDAMGMESLPSNIVTARGGNDPSAQPAWLPTAPETPSLLSAVTEWNDGNPRIHLSWHGSPSAWTYNVYRDGALAAEGVWGLNYFDAAAPGSSHTYTVTACNVPWTTTVESASSNSVTQSVPASAPSNAIGVVQVTGVTSNDDSVTVTFSPVPGAVDYRAYNINTPHSVKYSGGGTSIEMNAVDTVNGADLIVEAVDKLGPFQKMDGAAGPGSMLMDGSMSVATNGQGDPSNVPNVLARSTQLHVSCSPQTLSGDQAFFDNFRNSQAFTQNASLDPAIVAANGADPNTAANRYVREYSNDKWTVRSYWVDNDNTKIFVMSNHFMDTVYDGGTPRSNLGVHNCNASLVLLPKSTADISGGRVLHATFEVDAHFDQRRWCDLLITAAGDPLIHPAKLDGGLWPTVSGNMFRWEIKSGAHEASLYNLGNETDLTGSTGSVQRQFWNSDGINGGVADLDKRHKFDLYLSANRYRLVENGVVYKDAALPSPLPFTNLQVIFLHEVYHTYNDRPELMSLRPQDIYWMDRRPWSDERHWDNMGFEVLSSFPQ